MSVLWDFEALTRPHMRAKEKREYIQQLKTAKMTAHAAPHSTKERQRAVRVIKELRKEIADPESYAAKKNKELEVHQSAVSLPRYIMLREFGPPFTVEVLTTEGNERWKYFGSDDFYYFTKGKLTAYEKEKGKEIRVGMPTWEVLRKLGPPSSINRTVLAGGGGSEQWVYGDTYLYFSGGLLDAFQD